MIPKFFLWRVKKFLPIMRKNMMPDFASLINMNNNYNHISSKDLENFKIFVHEQKILLKK